MTDSMFIQNTTNDSGQESLIARYASHLSIKDSRLLIHHVSQSMKPHKHTRLVMRINALDYTHTHTTTHIYVPHPVLAENF